jgi:hypothetical protein
MEKTAYRIWKYQFLIQKIPIHFSPKSNYKKEEMLILLFPSIDFKLPTDSWID